jgi:hypothetical protein
MMLHTLEEFTHVGHILSKRQRRKVRGRARSSKETDGVRKEAATESKSGAVGNVGFLMCNAQRQIGVRRKDGEQERSRRREGMVYSE